MTNVVIIGYGFAGFSAARHFSRSSHSFEVTVVDKRATFDFLPLLPDIVGRPLSLSAVSCPIEPLSLQYGFNYVHDEVIALDLGLKRVQTNSTSLSYDYLIIAGGSETNFYGNDAVKKYAYTLDNVADAQRIRRALDTKPFGTCIVAGGGYTGIEIATQIWRYCTERGKTMKLLIVERSPSLLGPLPAWMKQYVSDNLEEMGIGVRTNTVIQSVDAAALSLSDGTVFENALLIWAAGVKTAGFVQNLAVEKNPQGRMAVDASLRLNEHCFAAGDAAFVGYKGGSLRMAVQFAITQGSCAAENTIRSRNGKRLLRYRPLDLGYVVPMANNRACAQVLGVNLKGLFPVWLHCLMCVYRCVGLKNKIGVMRAFLEGGGAMVQWASLMLRICLGVLFLAHGSQKAFGMFGGPGIEGFSKMLAGLGFSPALFWAYLGAYVEFVGGLCVLLGILPRISAAVLFVFMLVAILTVHISKGFFLAQGGFEYPFVIAGICIALVLLGPGKWSMMRNW